MFHVHAYLNAVAGDADFCDDEVWKRKRRKRRKEFKSTWLWYIYYVSCAISHHICTPNNLAHVHAPAADAVDKADKEEGDNNTAKPMPLLAADR